MALASLFPALHAAAPAVLCSLLLSAAGPVEDAPRPAPAAPAATAAKPAPAKKTWTAADLAKLRSRGVSVAGTREQPVADAGAADPGAAAAEGGEVVAKAEPNVADWQARAIAARQTIATGQQQMERIDQISGQWEAFVANTGANQAMAARELADLRESRKAWAEAVAQAEADLLYVEEAGRKAGVPPGQLR